MPDPLILAEARALVADPARAAVASPLARRLAWALLLRARNTIMAQRHIAPVAETGGAA